MLRQFILVIPCILLYSGCSPKKLNNEGNEIKEEKQAINVRENVLKSFHASSLSMQLHTWGEGFSPEQLSDIGRTHHYLQLTNRGASAANLGIYISDLGYLIEYKRTEDIQRYFDACFLLAGYVGLKKQFSQVAALQFSEIISGDEDVEKSHKKLFGNAQNLSGGYEFKGMHAAALAGYYVEELYHLAGFIESFSSLDAGDPKIQLNALRMLLNQQSSLANLIGYFDHLTLKPQGLAVYQDFLRLQRIFLSPEITRLLKETEPMAVLTDSHFQKLVSEIKSIRGSIADF